MLPKIHVFIISFILSMFCSFLFADSPEEALFARRIIEFWKEGDFPLVKGQSAEYLNEYPDGNHADSIRLILGNLLVKEKKFQEAMVQYDSIKDSKKLESIQINRLLCLYATSQFNKLENETRTLFVEADIDEMNPLLIFYRAESLFRQALLKEDIEHEELLKTCSQVIPLYESLLDGDYKNNSLLALAELNLIIANGRKAKELFLYLVDVYPDRAEELKYKAAEAIFKEDSKEALAILNEIIKANGKWSSKAALKWISFNFESENFTFLLKHYQEIIPYLEESASAQVEFLIGAAYYRSQNYLEAVKHLSPFLRDLQLPKVQKKALLSMLSGCAYHLHDVSLINRVVVFFNEEVPHDEDMAKSLLVRSLLRRELGNLKGAEEDLGQIIRNFPGFAQRQDALFSWAEILFQLEQWQRARLAFLQYKKEFPNSFRWSLASKYQISATQSLGSSGKFQDILLDDITALLEDKRTSDVERSKYLFIWAATLYEQGKFDSALGLLRKLLKENKNRSQLDEVHLLMAMNYNKLTGKESAFALHAEQALSLNPNLPEADQLRLNLFNTYLKLLQSGSEKKQVQQDYYSEKAANHIYQVLIYGKEPVERKKVLWLSQFYFQKLESLVDPIYELEELKTEEARELTFRVCEVLKSLCDFSEEKEFILLEEDELYLEREVYRLALILHLMGDKETSLAILKGLESQYEDYSTLPWKWKDMTYYLLGQVLEQCEKSEAAKQSYQKVSKHLIGFGSSIYHRSLLKLARLNFQEIKKKTLTDESIQVQNEVIKVLKDLQIRKHLPDEPIHLEAALDYSEFKVFFDDKDIKVEKQLSLLQKVKEEFTTKEDIQSKDYHARRNLYPKKDTIYQSYIMLIDAKIALLKSRLAFKKGRMHEAESYIQAAQTIFETLLEEKFAVTEYVIEKAKSELQYMGLGTS